MHKLVIALAIMALGIEGNRRGGRENEGSPGPGIPQGVSILPYPNGPFYGHPFDPRITWDRMLPLTVSGTCEGGKFYTIKSIDDFKPYTSEFECIFNAASAPVKVPEGVLTGVVLSVVNTRLFNQFAQQIWRGAVINKTECNGNETTKYIGWNNFLQTPLMPFTATIDTLPLNLAPGEYDNGRPSVILDYSKDITRECPEYGNQLVRNAGRAVARGASWASLYPINTIVEAIRYVGKMEDGKLIFIGKTYLKDAFRDDQQAATICYFAFISEDKDAMPLAISGLPTPPGNSFRYMIPGAADLALRLNPMDNFISAPIKTFDKLVRGVVNSAVNTVRFGSELPFGYNKMRRNIQNFRRQFRPAGYAQRPEPVYVDQNLVDNFFNNRRPQPQKSPMNMNNMNAMPARTPTQ